MANADDRSRTRDAARGIALMTGLGVGAFVVATAVAGTILALIG